MKFRPISLFTLAILGLSVPALAAGKFNITVAQNMATARPGEVITVPFSEVQKHLPGVQMYHFVVKDALGNIIPSQVTNYVHDDNGIGYDDLVFQHDFAAGEKSATFTVEASDPVVPPFPAQVFARFVPERYDDFAWENDRIAHRMYGPALASPAAGRSELHSSGIDVWVKKVRYPIIDRWYLKGHDQFHRDQGEGLDIYDMGRTRGGGGSGIWDGQTLHVSENFKSWKVLANGPLRAVFELSYAPWDAGNGLIVSETKRFTVEAGRNLDTVESTFTFEGAPEITVALGITNHDAKSKTIFAKNETDHLMTYWEDTKTNGGFGFGVVLAPDANFAGFVEEKTNRLMLAKVKSGQPLRYLTGAGWDRSLDFKSRADWEAYVATWPIRLKSPITVTLSDLAN